MEKLKFYLKEEKVKEGILLTISLKKDNIYCGEISILKDQKHKLIKESYHYVRHLEIEKTFRRQGLGSELINAAVEELDNKPILLKAHSNLAVKENFISDRELIEFYKGHGFKQIHLVTYENFMIKGDFSFIDKVKFFSVLEYPGGESKRYDDFQILKEKDALLYGDFEILQKIKVYVQETIQTWNRMFPNKTVLLRIDVVANSPLEEDEFLGLQDIWFTNTFDGQNCEKALREYINEYLIKEDFYFKYDFKDRKLIFEDTGGNQISFIS